MSINSNLVDIIKFADEELVPAFLSVKDIICPSEQQIHNSSRRLRLVEEGKAEMIFRINSKIVSELSAKEKIRIYCFLRILFIHLDDGLIGLSIMEG